MRISDLLTTAARDAGDVCAIIDHDDARFTWSEMAGAAGAAQAELQRRGVRAGDRVVIVLENAASVVAWFYGCALLEAIAVPVNARLTGPELQRIAAHSDAAAVVMSVTTGAAPRAHADAMQAEIVPGPAGEVAVATRTGATVEPLETDEHRVAVLLYTSGTTGAPKGAMLTHANLLAGSAASVEMRGMVTGDVTYLALPLSHVFGLVTMLAISRAQATMRLEARFDVARLYAALESDVTLLPAVPQMHAQLFSHAKAQGQSRYRRGLLRFTSSGGAPLDPAWKREAEAFYGIALQNGYGLTESTAGVCATRNDMGDPDTSVGVEMLGSKLRLNFEAPGAEPDKGIGEIETGGPQIMAGYFRDPEQSAMALTADGWLRTGDLGRYDSAGRLHIAGRSKELIIHSGFNVYPVEVEAALTEHPEVVLAAVVGRKRGGNEEVLAFVTCEPGAHADESALRDFARARLAPYKVPARIIIALALPAAPTGKILKSSLVERFARELGGELGGGQG